MNLSVILLFSLATIGMCQVIVDGSIMEWFRTGFKKLTESLSVKTGKDFIRQFGSVVDCYLCCGVWCGFFMGLVLVSWNPFTIFACGMAGGFLSYATAIVLNFLEAKTIVDLDVKDGK